MNEDAPRNAHPGDGESANAGETPIPRPEPAETYVVRPGLRRWTFPVGLLACNCSIIADPATRDAMVVDPGDDLRRAGLGGVDQILARLRAERLRLVAIAITHAHVDHIGAAARLKTLTGAPVLLQPKDHALYDMLADQCGWLGLPTPERTTVDAALGEAEPVKIGGQSWQVLETPGHTPGSCCLYWPASGQLLAGDTLFAGSIGRTDLPGGDMAQIVYSVHTKLLTLPDETVVVPGHGRETTIGEERTSNPFLIPRRAQFR